MASLLHLTESRNTKNEAQEKKRIINEQISIFKSISAIFYVAIGASFLFILYLCFVNAPKLSGANTKALQILSEHSMANTVSEKIAHSDIDLQNLALEIEENENCLLKDPYVSQEHIIANSRALSVTPPRVIYKGYYFDTSKIAIIEVAGSNTQIFIKEKQKFYSGTAMLLKIKKEEIVWRWHGNLYVTKIG